MPEGVELGVLLEDLVVLRQKLVERRIEQADGHREALHRREDPDEILALEGQELVHRLPPRLLVGRP